MAERLNISLDKGIHRTPTIGREGELSELVNMIPKNGQLAAIRECTVDFSYPDDSWTLLYVHENAGYKHYIHAKSVPDTDEVAAHIELYWTDATDGELTRTIEPENRIEGITTDTLADIYKLSHIGNTVIFLISSGTKMLVFKTENSTYKVLDGNIPELNISFGLKLDMLAATLGNSRHHHGLDINLQQPPYLTDTDNPDIQEYENWEYVSPILLAKRNQLISECKQDGYWVFPFFVRYALVMKDGTLIHCSSPVLMVPSTDNPYITIDKDIQLGDRGGIFIVRAKLDMNVIATELSRLKDYSDIIESVAIYVSEQFYTYEQDAEYKDAITFLKKDDNNNRIFNYRGGLSFGKMEPSPLISDNVQNLGYEVSSFTDLYIYGANQIVGGLSGTNRICITNTKKDIDEEIKTCSSFYLLREYSLNELDAFANERKNIDFSKNRLTNITSYQRMAEEEELRGVIIAKTGYLYNQRLNLTNLNILKTNPLSCFSLVNYITATGRYVDFIQPETGGPNISYHDPSHTQDSSTNNKQRYQLQEGDTTFVIENNTPCDNIIENAFVYVAIPERNASKLWMYSDGAYDENIELELHSHSLINSAYWFEGIEHIAGKDVHTIPELYNRTTASNALYQSLPSNPWVFPKSLSLNIGSGSIIGMAPISRPMSTGQFGQFPFVVFATDGIWTMQVNEDGTYKPAVLVSGDVCSNPESITQIDNAVLFVTKQGLKIISGSDVRLLTNKIEGVNINDNGFIPSVQPPHPWSDIVIPDVLDKRDLLQNCKMVYDYTDRLVHIFNGNDGGSAYKHDCLSLDSFEFASEVQIIGNTSGQAVKLGCPHVVVPGYPITLFQVGNNVYSYKGYDAGSGARLGYLITRPMAFGDFSRFKTIMDLRMYSDVEPAVPVEVERPNGVWCVLYGSNDRHLWHKITSCKGAPFKFFRIAIVTKLGKDDTLSGISLEYEERRGNKMK